MFIYSMETHLPYALNAASRDQDESKAETLGPISVIINEVIENTEYDHRL